ncbi:MAG TPA: FGGY family carbohydrate kinase [Bacteroidales bacterium]|nr:FGGY family carbohydrate kinase [Bacteroidales bacterium]
MKERVIAVFDIGKTNKKIILFNEKMKVVHEEEQKFPEVLDDDGFECDDLERIEKWLLVTVKKIAGSDKFNLTDINITTYGATIVCLDENGKRITPAYNYLKPIDEAIAESIYKRHGGRDEFCRRTASPALGMLNSGMQLLWLKKTKPDLFARIRHVLHFPQYLSYTLTGKIYSEHTSLGCHTALWDFDNMTYHQWINTLGIKLPDPVPVDTFTEIKTDGRNIRVGIGIHDSSSSLAPYFSESKGKFILLSTGTWCINMNPFNNEKLTTEQLDNDCLCYMSINRQPVKSSRLFLGHMHEKGTSLISDHFDKQEDYFKKVRYDRNLAEFMKKKHLHRSVFFKEEPLGREFRERIDMFQFKNFKTAYHQLMNELGQLTLEAVRLILPENNDISNIYITGGFSKNEHFLNRIKEYFPEKRVYRSEISNASALGAALVISGLRPEVNLGLLEVKGA